MSQAVFITATDTDAGKTWVTSHLIRALLEQRENTKAIKPVACGLNADGDNNDVKELLNAQSMEHASSINLYSFSEPAAPCIAAASEGKSIEPEHLKAWCAKQVNSVNLCLVEAVGGLMVPLTQNYLVSDWLADMPAMPVVLVVGAKLGCINHALLSLSHLSNIGREPAWVIINNTDGRQNTHTIRKSLQPYLPTTSQIIECGYNQPDDLAPLIFYLQTNNRSL